MTDLFAADLRRILWRPLTRALGATATTLIIAAGVIVFLRTGGRHSFNALIGLRTGFAYAVIPLAIGGLVMGASLLGADYPSRALTTLLTWEPRRARVLATPAAACAVVTACSSLVALGLLTVALLPAVHAHGTGGAPPGTWYVSMAGLIGRCALLAAAVSVIGVACAAIGRSTTAALAGVAVYWIGVQQAAAGLWPALQRWLFLTNAQSWVVANPHLSISSLNGRGAGHSVTTAGLLLLSVTLALHALATSIMRRRDVA